VSDHTVQKEVNAAPARVWDLLTDVDAYETLIRGITKVEILSESPDFKVGTRWLETRRMFGGEATEEMTVTQVDPGKSYTVEAESHGAHYKWVLSVEPSENGSILKMTFHAKPTGVVPGILANTIGRLFEHTTHKTLQDELDDIAAAAKAD
jgi:carbon monoxide dehydrogenase subunit G